MDPKQQPGMHQFIKVYQVNHRHLLPKRSKQQEPAVMELHKVLLRTSRLALSSRDKLTSRSLKIHSISKLIQLLLILKVMKKQTASLTLNQLREEYRLRELQAEMMTAAFSVRKKNHNPINLSTIKMIGPGPG